MQWTHVALVISGGFIQAGIAYPQLAPNRPGWKVGSWTGGGYWSFWYLIGTLAYLGGMGNVFGWIGLLAAIPAAFILGFALTLATRRHTQVVALAGPILANLWFLVR